MWTKAFYFEASIAPSSDWPRCPSFSLFVYLPLSIGVRAYRAREPNATIILAAPQEAGHGLAIIPGREAEMGCGALLIQ
ncbi:hypothetical protein L228DRAFT_244395 [Xylona heveae TC161]|uniref:Uncharacterized protein n=1 Tax=Xylona heveae (strain CBS 132557 / TC161) TaxID=1328760 RepID=A0A165IY91_XYLHT|nr:hypothetical protein L228DRAFT_244395 [Xylona heveae TC161]KZF25541.1 hypothetical protein L228DRAFT_244395 [Xylona heveae TC161]